MTTNCSDALYDVDILIIGGGASAMALMLQLYEHQQQPRVAIVAPNFDWAVGVAYGTAARDHLLNVPAGNMSLVADRPDHFVNFLKLLPDYAPIPLSTLRGLFVPRARYGDYLRWHHGLLRTCQRITWIDSVVTDLTLDGTATLSNETQIRARRIVVATGNALPVARWLGSDEIWIRYSAWQTFLLVPFNQTDPVLLLGSGLTMVDTYLALRAQGLTNPVIALSRHGLAPIPHATHAKGQADNNLPAGFASAAAWAEHLRDLKRLRAQWRFAQPWLRALLAQGSAEPLANALRPLTQQIWLGWTLTERKRFLRHGASRWNNLRHRIPPQLHEQLTEAQQSQQLSFQRGYLRGITPHQNGYQITVEHPQHGQQQFQAALIFNCTGPDLAIAEQPLHPLYKLIHNGNVQADPLGLGLAACPLTLNLLDPQGQRIPNLFAMGVLLRGTLWECTSIPDIREQAALISAIPM